MTHSSVYSRSTTCAISDPWPTQMYSKESIRMLANTSTKHPQISLVAPSDRWIRPRHAPLRSTDASAHIRRHPMEQLNPSSHPSMVRRLLKVSTKPDTAPLSCPRHRHISAEASERRLKWNQWIAVETRKVSGYGKTADRTMAVSS